MTLTPACGARRLPPLLLCAALLLWTAPASGQVAGPATARNLPDQVATAADAGPYAGQIDQYVAECVQRLVGPDASAVTAARDDLVRPLNETTAQAVRSPSFKEAYAAALARALLAAEPPNAAGRLNGAIVASRAADRTGSAALAPLAAKYAADESPAIASWGVRAAGPLMLALAQPANAAAAAPTTRAVVDAVRKHPQSGPVAVEAYEALSGQFLNAELVAQNPQFVAAAGPTAVAAYLDVLRARGALYADGLPPAPYADGANLRLLVDTRVWPRLPVEQHRAVIRAVADLAGAVTGQLANLSPSADRERYGELLTIVKLAASTLNVAGSRLNDAALTAACGKVSALGGASPPADVQARVAELVAAAERLAPATRPAGG